MRSKSTRQAALEQVDRINRLIEWCPLPVLLLTAFTIREHLHPWEFMWGLAFALFAGLKWQTWWKARARFTYLGWRSAAYLLAWPGMDADSFLDENQRPGAPTPRAWAWAVTKIGLWAILLWVIARTLPPDELLLRGWVGMIGLILSLHFGSFEFLSLFWRTLGVNAKPIMNEPLRADSLAEFWGQRWNLGFRQLSHDLIFRPAARSWGAETAGVLSFIISGLIHDLVISVPAHGGYGLPTTYFLVQGLGVALERSRIGKRAGIQRGLRGRLFMAAVAAGPVYWLFHPPFVTRVIIPFMQAVHAL
jgi:membrane bound O-acyltransferase family protein